MTKEELDRHALVINVGGGVIGDNGWLLCRGVQAWNRFYTGADDFAFAGGCQCWREIRY